MRVGFVGAGRMGSPMVQRLVGAGHDVAVLGRTDDKRRAAAQLGAQATDDVAAVAAGADVVVVCVFTDEQVTALCLDGDLVAGMRPGGALVLHTTGSPATARAIAGRFGHVDVVDAPLSGGPHDIAAGHVTVFAGGSDDALARVSPLLGAYADPIVHAGATGAGQLVKLINNTMFAAQIGLVAEGVRLGQRFGVDEGRLLEALTHGSAQSRVLSMIAAAGSADAFITAVGEFLAKDVAVVRTTVAELGGDLGELDALVNAGVRT
ncbi:NAD(P)-dependent oxidoreductase [Mycolicibacterium rufum]|uniref:NAD(P)-dependent oxidoreductase n=1 Tax=Mycolicibacterium rufum TaxID=318424 RepID=A0A9X3BJE9_9MYCO|nr:NAD(P)-dependent oxidoreductase [Mycolicibacterium rufum]KGI69154.1 6-phosphogluconate dehydrogenase [Mycolicibacterium rufum]MCV7072939.1 NAD(P)-dependent oxidoreductase [Mycolicibacterium rufum]ULP35340.1 NAD(P)-dependent oxidoreductase [Mycolicibacterium rufum]